MATNEGVGQPQVPDDPATAAFEALRKEVALVNRAMAGLAAVAHFNKRGYCLPERRILTDQEKIERAVTYVLETFPPRVVLIGRVQREGRTEWQVCRLRRDATCI